jgi:hypothetical protein
VTDHGADTMTTDEHGYNGWTNYETWNVALWIDNEEPSYRYWRDVAQEAWNDAEATETFTRREVAALALAARLKDEVTEGAPELTGTYGDLLGAALSEVNWHEIADNWLDDVEVEEEEEPADE